MRSFLGFLCPLCASCVLFLFRGQSRSAAIDSEWMVEWVLDSCNHSVANPVEFLCDWFEIHRSGFLRYLRVSPTQRRRFEMAVKFHHATLMRRSLRTVLILAAFIVAVLGIVPLSTRMSSASVLQRAQRGGA